LVVLIDNVASRRSRTLVPVPAPSPHPFDLSPPDPDAITALAPTGRLRAGINLSNFLLVSGAGSTGEPIGVSPSMAAAVADSIGTPLNLVTFDSPGEVADAVTSDCWDIGNIGADPARAEHIAFSAPYCEIESTYLVRRDSPIVTAADVDRPGVLIATKRRAAYSLWLERNITQARLTQVDTADEAFDRLAAEEVEVVAGLRPRLAGDAVLLPGSRVLDGRFTAVQQAIGTPRDRNAAGLAHLEGFVRAAIDSGFVAELIEHHGATGLSVAPPR
jgi:polar amino acid transport system substrate-binding protein